MTVYAVIISSNITGTEVVSNVHSTRKSAEQEAEDLSSQMGKEYSVIIEDFEVVI